MYIRCEEGPSEALAKDGLYTYIVHSVYIIQSIQWPNQKYTGIASSLKARLKKHNEGANRHTLKFKPWKLIWFCAFPTKTKAATFEKYLKTTSGIAFRRKRLM